MSKKNKKKTETKDTSAPAAAKTSTAPVERAFAVGNYAAVRHLAAVEPSETAERLVAITRLDMGQLAAGLFALLVVLTVAFFTLH